MESGQPVPEPVSVGLSCGGIRSVQVIHSDLKGNFQFAFGTGFQNNIDMSASNDAPNPSFAGRTNLPDAFASFGGSGQRLLGCELQVSVPGYQPLSKTITDTGDIGVTDAGTLVLRRLAGVQGSAISVTSLLVPNTARKEFEKGEKEARNQQLESATQHLQKAVALYDKYAAAWNELGRVYAIGHQAEKARQAFEKAIAADPHYIPPVVNLASLQLQERQYESAVETAGNALVLDPGAEIAEFVQAAANFKLDRLDAAEKSARDAEDRPHQNIPQLHVILAEIFLRKQDYSNAVAEMRAYLKESPRGEFAAAVKKTLDQMDKSAVNTGNKSVLSPQRPQIAP